MRIRVIPWPLFGVIACFAESDVPLGGSESQASGDESSATATTGPPTTTATTSEPATSEPATSESLTDSPGTSSSSGDPTHVDGTTDTGEDCPAGTRRVPQPLPIGWDGVEALSLDGGRDAPKCPDGLAETAQVFEGPLTTDCTCSCSPLCWITGFQTEGCDDRASDAVGADPIFCGDFDDSFLAPMHVGVTEIDGLADTGGCPTPEATPTVVGSQHRVCDHSSGTACMPAPDGVALAGPCVSRDGDVPCPMPSEYTERRVVVSAATGTCAACESCVAAAITGCAAGEVTLYDEHGCSGTPTTFSASVCSAEVGYSATIEFDADCPGHVGSVDTSGTRTYCCVP